MYNRQHHPRRRYIEREATAVATALPIAMPPGIARRSKAMRRPAILIGSTIAAIAAIAIALAAGNHLAEPTSAGEPAPTIIFHIDCNNTTPGIQTNCNYPTNTTQVDVDVVLENATGAAIDLGAFGFELVGNRRLTFMPASSICDTAGLDCNPNFNQASITASGWACSPPPPSPDLNNDGDPLTSQSSIGCFTSGLPPAGPVSSGGFLTLATTRYDVTADAAVDLTLRETSAFDANFNELGTCPVVVAVPATCNAAHVIIGTGASPTPTPTATSTPTPSPTFDPQMTPSGTPTGGVYDTLALNEAVCTVLGSLANIDATTAAFACQLMNFQGRAQAFVECLNGRPYCPSEPSNSEVYQQIEPRDLAFVDVDGDQFHPGQSMIIGAFVEGDYPVLFETSVGGFPVQGTTEPVQQVLCYAGQPGIAAPWDPDCDANPETVGDGFVAIRLLVDQDDPRGSFNVTVTQAGKSHEQTVIVTGPPVEITLESLDLKTSIETGALGASFPGFAKHPDACDIVINPDPTGSVSPKTTDVLVRAKDSDGTDVISFMAWTTDGQRSNPAVFRGPGMPHGGPANPQLLTWDLGPLGVGFVQRICGGATAGTLSMTLVFSRILDPLVPEDFSLPYSIQVIGDPVVPVTPTPNACPSDDFDCDGVLDSSDNCYGNPNPDQRNNDANYIDHSPPFASVADDRTRVDSDNVGDVCDIDDDNDGLFDVDENGGPPCLTASGSTNPLSDDSDGDRFLDGAECAIGTDPLDSNNRPPLSECGPDIGLPYFGVLSSRTAFCKYGSGVDVANDSDADGLIDLCEIASINHDRIVNVADMGMLASAIAKRFYHPNADINRDGDINTADQGSVAAIISSRACFAQLN